VKSLILCAALCACTTHEENLGTTETEVVRWAVGAGGRGYESTDAVAIDSIGDVLVAGGGYLSTADLGNGPIGNDGMGGWSFLTKRVASDGSSRWSIAINAALPTAGVNIRSLAIAADDSILVGGEYGGKVSFGGHVVTGGAGSVFVAKLSTDGTMQWIHDLGPDSLTQLAQMSLDPAGNIVLSGRYGKGTFDFLGQHYDVLTNDGGFVVELDPQGTPLWGHFFANPDGLAIEAHTITSAGDVVVSGTFAGSAAVGGAVLDALTARRGFLARFRSDGLYLWSRTFGVDGGTTDSSRIATLAGDNFIVTSLETPPSGWMDEVARLTVFDSEGRPGWSTTIPAGDAREFGPLAGRDRGVIGAVWQEVESPTNPILGHIQLATFDAGGEVRAGGVGKRVSDGGRTTAVAATATGPHGELAVVGQFAGSIDLGFGPIVTHGTDDSDALMLVIEPPAN
jgi:hypothetical protein